MAGEQDVRLAEYASLRAEIAQRSSFQQALLALHVSSVAAIVGVVITKGAPHTLLLLVPVISAVLGLLWLNHARNIKLISDYIAGTLWLPEWPQSWESWRDPHATGWDHRIFWYAILVSFGAPPVGSIAAWIALGHWSGWTTAGFILDCVVIAAVAIRLLWRAADQILARHRATLG